MWIKRHNFEWFILASVDAIASQLTSAIIVLMFVCVCVYLSVHMICDGILDMAMITTWNLIAVVCFYSVDERI